MQNLHKNLPIFMKMLRNEFRNIEQLAQFEPFILKITTSNEKL